MRTQLKHGEYTDEAYSALEKAQEALIGIMDERSISMEDIT
jgi:hypothetical protein